MDTRRLFLLSVLLAGLVSAGLWLKGRENAAAPTLREEQARVLPGKLTLEELTAVELSVGAPETPQVRIEKDPERGWRVAGARPAPADAEKLDRFVEAVSGLTGEERARGEKWFADFGLDEEKGLTILLRQGEQVRAALVAGRSPKNPAVEFVRRRDGDTVYAAESGLLGWAGLWGAISGERLSPDRWVDFRVFPAAASEVRRVEIAEPAKEGWKTRTAREDLSDEKVKDWLERLVTLRGTAVVEAPADFRPAWRWTLERHAGPALQVEEAAPADKSESVTVRLSPEGPCFSASAEVLRKYREELSALPAPEAPPQSSSP